MPKSIEKHLSVVAGDVAEHLRRCPNVDRFLGHAVRLRLRDPDWIKCPELVNFALPMTMPRPWKPTDEERAHLNRRSEELGQDATTLDAFESSLSEDVEKVAGFKKWFKEFGNVQGVHFDRRLHSLANEMHAIGLLIEMGQVTKLAPSPLGGPDYFVDLPYAVATVEAKTVLGRAWPVGVMQTMLRALVELDVLPSAANVMAVASDPTERTERLDSQVGGVTVDQLVTGIKRASQGEPAVVGSFNIVPRSPEAKRFGLHASYLAVDSLDAWVKDHMLRHPEFATITRAALEAWSQCEKYQSSSLKPRLDLAWVSAEGTFGHPEVSPLQSNLQIWLEQDVWPSNPRRAFGSYFPDISMPVWMINPTMVRKELSNAS